MKLTPTKFLPLLAILAFLSPLPAVAGKCGGSCGGSGNRITSTAEEVDAAVATVKERMLEFNFAYGMRFQAFNPAYVSDPKLKKVLRRHVAPVDRIRASYPGALSGGAFVNEAEKSAFIPQAHCYDEDGLEVDSYTDFRSGADVCFNRTRLMNMPPETMRVQVWGLAYHELDHHLQPRPTTKEEREGLEAESRALQEYVLEKYGKLFSHMNSSLITADGRLLEIFPGGTAELSLSVKVGTKVRSGKVAFVCGRQQDPNFVPPAGTIQIEPGQVVSGKNPDGARSSVVCMDLPRIRCVVQPTKIDGRDGFRLLLGDFPQLTEFKHQMYMTDMAKDYTAYVRAGVCEPGFQMRQPEYRPESAHEEKR